MKNKFRIVSQQYRTSEWNDFQIDDVLYSPRVNLKEADGLVALYDPTEELLEFSGPKVWFTIEPKWHHHFHSHPIGKKLMRKLDESEHVFYGNPNPAYRVPHPTFRGPMTFPRQPVVREAAVACVSNYGGRLWFLKKHIWSRNRMILDPLVELYGNLDSWKRFRDFPRVWRRGLPLNHQGRSSPGNGYYSDEYLLFLSEFKVAVCLENCLEERYFTEKYVNAARAGCIPVYHAHPSVREMFLKGAKWVDPADFGFSPSKTIRYALEQDQAEFRRINDAWLLSGAVADTDDRDCIKKIHQILRRKLIAKAGK